MSVVGFDFGSVNCVTAITQKGGVDIVVNESSSRKTPSMVSFGDTERYVGDTAISKQIVNIKNTICHVKRLIGRNWSDPDLQAELPMINTGFSIVELPDDKIGVEVMYKNEKRIYTPTQLTAMIFSELSSSVEKGYKQSIADLVISVPGYFDEYQRRAIIDSAKIAGLMPMGVINDITAAAVHYGFYKNELSETDPRRVAIIDIGDTSTSAAIVNFYKNKLEVVETSYDPGLGGRNNTNILANHFANKFQEKHKVDIRTNPKSWRRMLNACDKLKPTLNTNPIASLNVDFLYEEIDFSTVIKREEYEEMIADTAARLDNVIIDLLARSKLNKEDIHFVELIGSGSRTLVFQKRLSALFEKDLSFTMNAEEAIAKGAALFSAIHSPRFKVRKYEIKDLVTTSITQKWQSEGSKERSVVVFKENSLYPSPKHVTLKMKGPFTLTSTKNVNGQEQVLAQAVVEKLPEKEKDEALELKIRVSLDMSGLVRYDKIETTREIEVEEEYKVPIEEEPMEEEKSEAPEQPETEEKPSEEQPAEEKPTEEPTEEKDMDEETDVDKEVKEETERIKKEEEERKKKEEEEKKKPKFRIEKRRVKKMVAVPIEFVATYAGAYHPAELEKYVEIEAALYKEKQESIAIYDAKNAVESYIYSSKDKLYDLEVESEEEKNKFIDLLNDTEEWLNYGEGSENQPVNVYVKKLAELKEKGDAFFVVEEPEPEPEPEVEEPKEGEEGTEKTEEDPEKTEGEVFMEEEVKNDMDLES